MTHEGSTSEHSGHTNEKKILYFDDIFIFIGK